MRNFSENVTENGYSKKKSEKLFWVESFLVWVGRFTWNTNIFFLGLRTHATFTKGHSCLSGCATCCGTGETYMYKAHARDKISDFLISSLKSNCHLFSVTVQWGVDVISKQFHPLGKQTLSKPVPRITRIHHIWPDNWSQTHLITICRCSSARTQGINCGYTVSLRDSMTCDKGLEHIVILM